MTVSIRLVDCSEVRSYSIAEIVNEICLYQVESLTSCPAIVQLHIMIKCLYHRHDVQDNEKMVDCVEDIVWDTVSKVP
jgi:hypothetical protein